MIAAAGAASLAVAMGIGRFAFTPLLPMMLHDGVISLAEGARLATANYAGYLAGALLCMALPRRWPAVSIIRVALAATVLLTAGMAAPAPALWPALRFLAGVASAAGFVFTSGWCLSRLAELGEPALGSAIYAGPGAGIALSGLAAGGMVAFGWPAAQGWLAFAFIAALASALISPLLRGEAPARAPAAATAPAIAPPSENALEMAMFAVAYGLAGFGYIVTATFLPVIARHTIPGSPFIDLFWPIFGAAAAAGSLIAARRQLRLDARLLLAASYLCQAAGVSLSLFIPTAAGFAAGSLMAGLAFNAISFFAMQEARRLRPHHVARFMGLLTALYGLGQMAGPPLTSAALARAGVDHGFTLALAIAGGALVAGAALFLLMMRLWPAKDAR